MRIPHGLRAALASQGAAPSAYQIQRSLRFDGSAYLSRTPASAGNRKTWTYSFWFKLGKTTGYQYFFSANNPSGGSSNFDLLQMDNSASTIVFYGYNGSSFDWLLSPTAVFRDPSAWQHFVIAFDTTQATASNRVKWWHNGNLLILDRSGYTTYPSLNLESRVNNTVSQRLSDQTYGLDSYLADIHFIDGQALTPTSFAETNATTGQWVPKAYSGSYGTNGFKLDFADNSNNTASTLGKDTSGNGLNWTPSGFSVTAGAGNDSLVDTPTSYGTDTGAGGEVRGNYATLNPLSNTSGRATLSNGNLQTAGSGIDWETVFSTFAFSSGKWYMEATVSAAGDGQAMIGICKDSDVSSVISFLCGSTANSYSYYSSTGNKFNNTSGPGVTYGASYGLNDVIGVALDMDAGTLQFYKNGVSQGQAYSGLSGAYFFCLSTVTNTWVANFGQRPFAYTAPSGFKALCDTNLPTPAIAKPNTVMDVKLYTGNGSTQTISGLGFSPDLVWIKSRANAYAHTLHDTVRGANKQLFSNLTNAEQSDTNQLTAFNSDGFTLGDNSTGTGGVNFGTGGYVAWTWDAGSSTVTNTQGSITSSVRANTSAGFSIVTYTGNGTAGATAGHGLGTTPSFIIVKNRTGGSYNWIVYSAVEGATKYLSLNQTIASTSLSTIWNNTTPSSTVFTIGTDASVNSSSATYVAYCFAPVAGYSSFGSYTGNGSTDGPFVYTGFRPRWILIKRTDTVTDWWLYDTARNPYNVMASILYTDLSDAEYTGATIFGKDSVSNGFKLRTSNSIVNGSGATYIYAAFGEPFQYARAR